MDKKEFLKARKNSVRASDIPAILGICPFRTAYTVYLDKISKKVEFTGNYATEKGNAMEPIARAKYEILTDKSYPPLMVTNSHYNFLGCSLDGCSEDQKSLIEIKWIGNNFLNDIKKDKPNYWAQIQFQMLVTGITNAHLVEINSAEEIKATSIPLDEEYCEMLFSVAKDFWSTVIARIPPKLTIKDSIKLQDKDKIKAIKKMRSIKSKMDKLTEEYKSLEENVLKGLAKHGHSTGLASITCVKRIGSISYKKIPELAGVDLEQYRGADSKYFKFNFKKAGKK